MSTKQVVHLDEALQRRIADLAQTTGVSPADYVREAVEALAARRNGGPAVQDSGAFWDQVDRIVAAIPEEEADKLPPDLAKNFDHYRYGHPRED